MIKYVKHTNIDKTKWDNCISKATNTLIYGYSWYLDIVCENWDALILDEYVAVMPLPWKKKFGIKYIYHPFFAQQLGIFFQNDINPNVEEFISKIPRSFIKYEISFNVENTILNSEQFKRLNLVLPINSSYSEIHKNFNTNTKRNIKKLTDTDLHLDKNVLIDDILKLKKANPVNILTNKHFATLKTLFSTLIEKKLAEIIGVLNERNELLSAALFIKHQKRIIYLFSASATTGKANSSMFKIINHVIQKNCEQDYLIDFEGSMVPGVARFFKGFGAQEEYYNRILKFNLFVSR